MTLFGRFHSKVHATTRLIRARGIAGPEESSELIDRHTLRTKVQRMANGIQKGKRQRKRVGRFRIWRGRKVRIAFFPSSTDCRCLLCERPKRTTLEWKTGFSIHWKQQNSSHADKIPNSKPEKPRKHFRLAEVKSYLRKSHSSCCYDFISLEVAHRSDRAESWGSGIVRENRKRWRRYFRLSACETKSEIINMLELISRYFSE